MKRFWRVCSAVLVLSMLVNMLPMYALATEMQPDDQQILTEDQNVQADDLVAEMTDEELLTKETHVLSEVIGERTEYSKTFRLSNGLNMAAVYSEPVHYDKDGQWEEIDNTLQLSSGRSGNAYTNTAGKWLVTFPQRLTENNSVTISMEDYFLSFRMTGELHNTGDAVMDAPDTGEENTAAADNPADADSTGEVNTEVPDAEIPSDEGRDLSAEASESISAEDPMLDTTTGEGALTDAHTTTDMGETVSSQEETNEASDDRTINEDDVAVQASAADRMAAIVSDSLVASMSESDIFVEQTNTYDMRDAVEHEEMIADKIVSSLRYEDVYTNTDLVYDLISNQVKESIIMRQYRTNLRGYQYVLEMENLRPVLTDDNVIELYDKTTNELVMLMPAPFLVDSAEQYCYDVGVLLQEENGSYVLSYVLPQEWLADESRVWPVKLDPAVKADTSTVNILDQTVYSLINLPYTEGVHTIGYRTGYGIGRTYLMYDQLPVLSTADVIVSASLSLYKPYDSSNSCAIEVHKVNATWTSSTINWSNKPEYDSAVDDYIICQKGSRYYKWDVTDIVRGWYTSENTGLMLKATKEVEDAAVDSWYQFYSSDYGIECKPTLTITFRNNNGLEDYWDYTASSAGRAGTGYVNNYSGNLVFIRDDIGFGGNRMPVTITHVYNSNDGQKNEFGMGYGWRTNFNQRVYHWNHPDAAGKYYVWEDADGTAHYFLEKSANTYADEDGLQLTLTTGGSGSATYKITDLYGNVSYFDDKGRLTKIENNQVSKSSISITYTDTTNYYIKSITDGIGRKYDFSYYASNTLSQISYKGTGSSALAHIQYTYSNGLLTTVTYQDSEKVHYSYISKGRLIYAQDVDGYSLNYTYSNASSALSNVPSRVKTVTETHNGATGGKLTFAYSQKQTTITDTTGNVQIHQFNNWGNTVSIQDNQGRAQYAQYAINDPEESTAGKGNQLRLASKMQNTVGNVLVDTSFENGTNWIALSSSVTGTVTTEAAYMGSKSLKMTRPAEGGFTGLRSEAISIPAGETYTFSGYVKTVGGSSCLVLTNGSIFRCSDYLPANTDWTRLEVSYTNTTSTAVHVSARVETYDAGTTYLDCVQVEKAPTASRYNLVQNGDFRFTTFWSASGGRGTPSSAAPAPELNATAYKLTGSPTATRRLSQTVAISGSAGDSFVLAGWAMGSSVPLATGDSATAGKRKFGLILTFNNTDGTTTVNELSFNPYVPNWQYAATGVKAAKAYSSVKIELAYDYNANQAWFDGIQLFKETFGTSYTYDDNGNVVRVADLQAQNTTYEYTNNNLTKMTLPSGAKVTYTYDAHHNVLTATTGTGVVYSFTYDQYGNNTSVSIGSGSSKITSNATYSSDGNRLVSTTDAAGNVTTYGYDIDTNVLKSVQYPEDTAATKTNYTYDSMYRVATAAANTSGGSSLSAEYTYADDLLSTIKTANTTYSFTYGNFGLRSSVKVGNRNLASYSYTNRTNYLASLDYGNGDKVQYTYDNQGRLTLETFEDGDTVTYAYDNTGALAQVADSASGITTKYYYDLTDRLLRYVENGSSYRHSVDYEYDDDQNLTQLVNTINESVLTAAYTYDKDNRIVNLLNTLLVSEDEIAGASAVYTYDSFGRLSGKTIQENAVNILTVGYQFAEGAENGATSTRVSELKLNESGDGFRRTYAYTYDDNGNLLSVSDGTNTTTYVYDSANQLIRENNQAADKTWIWTYDNAGNILAKTEYPYTTGDNPSNGTTVEYAYNDTLGWGDLLTGYNNHTINYDAIGNPVTIENSADEVVLEYTWEHGRQLAGLHGVDMNGGENDVTVSYTYNADGIRMGKTVTTELYITHVHSYAVSEVVMPTCTQGGYKLYTCVCGDQYTDEMAALGHDFRGDSGLISTTCRRCGASRVPTFPIVPPGGTIILGEGSGAETMSVSAEGERILVSTVLTEYEYVYTGAELTQMIVTTTVDEQSPTTQTLYFTYETSGPMTVTCDGTTYYYAANLQGDIIAILDADGVAVVEYTYDAWGNILSVTGSKASTVGLANPLRYRGYVYDVETQLYYCQSRYYNPEVGRWLNADAFAATGQGLIGNNMFAYCNNNPVNYADRNGYEPEEVVDVDGDGVVDYYVYTYTSTTGILWWKKQQTGRVYIFVGKSTEFFDDSANHPDNFNSKTDLLVGDYTTSNNPMMYAYRADRTETKNRSSILQCLLQYDKDFDTAWDRTLDSLLVEWREHKRYAFASDRARNIDFDNAEEGMGASYYFKKAWNAVFD